MAEEKKDPISLDLDLMFAPDWARQSPAETRQHFSHVSYQDHDDEPGGRRRDGKWNERGSRSGNRDREHPRREERRNMLPAIPKSRHHASPSIAHLKVNAPRVTHTTAAPVRHAARSNHRNHSPLRYASSRSKRHSARLSAVSKPPTAPTRYVI
jgi:hypothetical protein